MASSPIGFCRLIDCTTCLIFNFKKKKKRRVSSFKNGLGGVPVMAQWLTNPLGIHGGMGMIPGLAQWVEDLALPWAVA